MASITQLPVELKIMILSYLSFTSDLTAISDCSPEFRLMKREKHWKSIQDVVFDNETREQLSGELLVLWNVRLIKSRMKARQGSCVKGDYGWNLDPEKVSIRELSEIRRTIRWFTVEFLRHHLRTFQQQSGKEEEEKPTMTEILRVDDAFCTFWLFMELSFDPISLSPVELDISMMLGYLDDRDEIRRAISHNGVLLVVYKFLRSRLADIGKATALALDSKFAEDFSHWTFCLSRFSRIGIPNMLLAFLGLDGVKHYVSLPFEEQIQRTKKYFVFDSYLDESLVYPNGETDLLKHFINLIDAFCELPCLELGTRPLWKQSGGVYRIFSQPWGQPGLHLDAVFWDDQRLRRWGYQFPAKIVYDRNHYGVSLESVMAREIGYCNECLPGWSCSKSKKFKEADLSRLDDMDWEYPHTL